MAQGRVREGHGDLRAEHICLVGKIEIFDCVEFDAALRYGDIASDIAFLAMDLDFSAARTYRASSKAPTQRRHAIRQWQRYCPFINATAPMSAVKSRDLKSEEQEISSADRQRASLQALRYFCLATRYTESRRKPILLIVCGLIATGKSTVAGLVSNLTGFPVFSSDQVRKNSPALRRRAGAPTNSKRHLRRAIHRTNVREFTRGGGAMPGEGQRRYYRRHFCGATIS